ncbi:MAG: accessory factor UbiK family protein [Deltaproteobacteria bacterium]|nr:accessory factor UbiK family protein [Deltaproteobacteria bacterium]
MADILDKAILIGIGLEKKAKEVLDELQQAGKSGAEASAGATEGGLPPKEAAENKIVEEGIRALREFLAVVKTGKERLDKEFSSSSEKVFERLNVATQNDIDVIKEMARIAREKVDRLEKRVAELEARLGNT